MNADLADLFNRYGSDKTRNGYSPLYKALFEPLKDSHINFLEIGIGTMIPGLRSSMVGYSLPGYSPGGSLRAWRDFFINGRIFGMDVAPDTQFREERIQTFLVDSTNSDSVNGWKNSEIISSFDVILDDGCHAWESQLSTLKNLYPLLVKDGFYVIEDIYPGSQISENPGLVRDAVGHDEFFYVGIKNNQCVIRKRQ
jgi:hypothetical protein